MSDELSAFLCLWHVFEETTKIIRLLVLAEQNAAVQLM